MLQSNIEQVLDYALDLKNFHLLSQNRIIIPILVPTLFRTSSSEFIPSVYDDSIYNPLVTGANGLQKLIADVLTHAGATVSDPSLGADWIISPYSPTPTIIEAAKRLYENHSVEDITRHEADKVSTDRTIAYILNVIKTSREKGEKSICFVTGADWTLPSNSPIRMAINWSRTRVRSTYPATGHWSLCLPRLWPLTIRRNAKLEARKRICRTLGGRLASSYR